MYDPLNEFINPNDIPGHSVDTVFQDSEGYQLEDESPETSWRRSRTFSTLIFGAYKIDVLLTRPDKSSEWEYTYGTSAIWTSRGWVNIITSYNSEKNVPSYNSEKESVFQWSYRLIGSLYINSIQIVSDFSPSLLPQYEGQ